MRRRNRQKPAMAAVPIVATVNADTVAVMVAVMAVLATMATALTMPAKAALAVTVMPHPASRPRRGSQTASKMLHLCSVRANRAAMPATAHAEATGDHWM